MLPATDFAWCILRLTIKQPVNIIFGNHQWQSSPTNSFQMFSYFSDVNKLFTNKSQKRDFRAYMYINYKNPDQPAQNAFIFQQKSTMFSYGMEVVTKQWSIAEKISRLSWDSNLVCSDKNPML